VAAIEIKVVDPTPGKVVLGAVTGIQNTELTATVVPPVGATTTDVPYTVVRVPLVAPE
jgi:hypothetical protein